MLLPPRNLNRLNLSYRIVASICGTNRPKSLLSHPKSTKTSTGTHTSFVEPDLDDAKIWTPRSPMYGLHYVSGHESDTCWRTLPTHGDAVGGIIRICIVQDVVDLEFCNPRGDGAGRVFASGFFAIPRFDRLQASPACVQGL